MLNEEREAHYTMVKHKRKLKKSQQRTGTITYYQSRTELTPAQERRLAHKEGSRKTHEHDRTAVLMEGKKFRCTKCMPAGFAETTAVKAAPGPRDWTREDLHQRSVL